MSNLTIDRSSVAGTNLTAMRSRVEGTNLIIDEDTDNYVFRFAPEIMDGNDTMSALYEAERCEVTDFTDSLISLSQDYFIKTMGLNRTKKWEQILELEPSAASSVEDRKNAILQKMFFRPPYTRLNFYEFLYSLFGEGRWSFLLPRDKMADGSLVPDFTIIIDVAENNPKKYLKFQTNIRNIVPANMYLIFSIQYTHLFLEHGNIYGFRYVDIEQFSYGELSKYANWDKE